MGLRRLWLPTLAAAAIAGCAEPERVIVIQRPAEDPAMVQAMEIAARQVRRCYRDPRVPSAARQIVTHLRVRIDPDGSVPSVPAVISQSGIDLGNRTYAARMAEAAIDAVLRCAPLRLPPEVHRGTWVTIDLTFSAGASA